MIVACGNIQQACLSRRLIGLLFFGMQTVLDSSIFLLLILQRLLVLSAAVLAILHAALLTTPKIPAVSL